MIITKEQLEKMKISDEWLDDINKTLSQHKITDKIETAMFLAQCSHESKYFTRLEENLNYTPERLLEVFSDRVTSLEKAKEIFAGGIKSIGNFVYNGRLGNSIGSDDGYNYRGRGIIQLTGKANYKEFSKHINVDLVSMPSLAKEKYNALLIALIFWQTRKCSVPAQNADVKAVTKIINGKYNGLSDREKIFSCYKKILEA